MTTELFGPTDPYRWLAIKHERGIELRVFVKGEDVTSRCRFLDDTPGQQRAELFPKDWRIVDGNGEMPIEVVQDFEVRAVPA